MSRNLFSFSTLVGFLHQMLNRFLQLKSRWAAIFQTSSSSCGPWVWIWHLGTIEMDSVPHVTNV